MDRRPELSPEEEAAIREKVRWTVGIAALRRIQQHLAWWKGPESPAPRRTTDVRSRLSPEEQALIQDKTQWLVGYIGLRKIQQFVREFQEEEAFKRRAAKIITVCCAVLVVAGALLYIGAPGVLEALFRMFS